MKNDPAQLDKVISCLQNALKLGNAPPESKPTVSATNFLLFPEWNLEEGPAPGMRLYQLQFLQSEELNI